MGIVALLLGRQKQGTVIRREVAGKTASIILDATVSEKYTATSEVTDHPVEAGIYVTDHIIQRPQRLEIEGVITKTPMDLRAQLTGAATTIASRVGQEFGGRIGLASRLGGLAGVGASVAASKTFSAVFRDARDTRLRDAVNEFLLIREARVPITIVTGLRQYENFVLETFEINRDDTTGDSMRVTLSLKEVIIAATQEIKIEIPKIEAALPSQEQGRKTTEPVTGENERKSSILFSTLGLG